MRIPTDDSEFAALRHEVAALRAEIRRYAVPDGRKVNQLFSEFRRQCAEAAVRGHIETASDLINRAASGSPLAEQCKAAFSALYESMIEHLKAGEVPLEAVSAARERLAVLQYNAPTDHCTPCFREASRQLDRQLRLIESIHGNRDEQEGERYIDGLSPESLADRICYPLSSPHRVRILKALYLEGRSFSDLAKITGLRGGNLLFHLEKLLEVDLIRQRGDRGEYCISLSGYESLRTLAELNRRIQNGVSAKQS